MTVDTQQGATLASHWSYEAISMSVDSDLRNPPSPTSSGDTGQASRAKKKSDGRYVGQAQSTQGAKNVDCHGRP